MRLKTYTGDSIKDVMSLVRKELGPDAIIVSSQQSSRNGPVKIIAAVEAGTPPPVSTSPVSTLSSGPATPVSQAPQAPKSDPVNITDVFQRHGTPRSLAETLIKAANAVDADEAEMALAYALDGSFRFLPFSTGTNRPIMLVGAPGVGKTSSIAKLAAAAAVENRKVTLITTDTVRTGGIEQLDGYGKLLKNKVIVARSSRELATTVLKAPDGDRDLTLIDTAGINLFSDEDVTGLKDLIDASNAEPVAVLAAGGDPYEAAEFARIFGSIGARRFIATRLDTTYRLGSLLVTASTGPLAFSCVSATPFIGDGLQQLNPVSLARLLIASRKSTHSTSHRKVAAKQ